MLKKINGVTGEVTMVPTPATPPKTNEDLIEEWNKKFAHGLSGFLHADMREWTYNAFSEKDKQKEEAVAEARREATEREKYVPRFKGINLFSKEIVKGAGCYTSEKGNCYILEDNKGEEPIFTPVEQIDYDWFTPPTN